MVLVFGSINQDFIFLLPALPAAGETVLASGFRAEPGGKGANQAVAAARDGAKVIMAGAVGGDALARPAMELMRGAGVDVSRVAIVEAATGCAGIFVDAEGRNAIAVGSEANLLARAEQIEDALLGPATILLLQMELPATETAALIGRARSAGARIILNLAPAGPLPPDVLKAVDILVVNEAEASWLAKQMGTDSEAAALNAALAVTVVRTLGADGVEARGPQGTLRVQPRRVKVIDTTGAGDCFVGVLAASLDRSDPFAAALERANAAAALCCTRAGSQATMPTAAETDRLSAAR